MTRISTTDLDVFGLCLGGNVFGWTADEGESFAVLDAYLAAGGNFVDTADVYLSPNPGISETIIGRWMAARSNRDEIVIATKVGADGGLGESNIREHIEGSLQRLGTDRVDLYYAHKDDPDTPIEEALRTFDGLVGEGKVRHIAASNFTADRLEESLATSKRDGLASYVALQPHYNLMERESYESELAPLVAEHSLSVMPYYGLAKGFLTGKYRPGGETVDSPRAGRAAEYLESSRGPAVLEALDEIAGAHETTVAAVALAWLEAQPNVTAPIASARNAEQLEGILPAAALELSADELDRLTAASD
jgi:aryl-alcohol dehydrogenase-like predicted oxidoreductase